jgi:hypothetical protein
LPLDQWTMRLSVSPQEHRPILHCMAHTTVICYSTRFGIRDLPNRLLLLMDDVAQYIPAHYGVLSGYRDLEVVVNGQVIAPFQRVDYPDHYVTASEITPFLKQGHNQVSLYIAQSNERPSAPTLQYPMMLCGDFSLDTSDELVAVTAGAASFWDEAGAPYYSGIGCYEYHIRLEEPRDALWLDLGEVHESARILVNGQEAATRGWVPYVLAVPGPWRAGDNLVQVRVANTAANLWEKRKIKSGMSGMLRYSLD